MAEAVGKFAVDCTGVGATPRVVGRCPDSGCDGQLMGWLVNGHPIMQCRNVSTLAGRVRSDGAA